MSGGSHNYLYRQIDTEGCIHLADLDGMASRLEEIAPGSAAAADTRRLVDLIRRAATGDGALAEVWRSVEWFDSRDYGEDQALEQIAAYEQTAAAPGETREGRR
jgi:hypothetical protein